MKIWKIRHKGKTITIHARTKEAALQKLKRSAALAQEAITIEEMQERLDKELQALRAENRRLMNQLMEEFLEVDGELSPERAPGQTRGQAISSLRQDRRIYTEILGAIECYRANGESSTATIRRLIDEFRAAKKWLVDRAEAEALVSNEREEHESLFQTVQRVIHQRNQAKQASKSLGERVDQMLGRGPRGASPHELRSSIHKVIAYQREGLTSGTGAMVEFYYKAIAALELAKNDYLKLV